LALALAGISSPVYLFPAFLLLLPSVLGILRAAWRYHLMERQFPEHRQEMGKTRWRVILLDFLVNFLVLYNIAKAKSMKSISWRGREYRMG